MPANSPPEDALWLQDIEEQLISLVRTAEQRWQRIAALLIEVGAQALWQGAAASYTAWVQAVADKAGVHWNWPHESLHIWETLSPHLPHLKLRLKTASIVPQSA